MRPSLRPLLAVVLALSLAGLACSAGARAAPTAAPVVVTQVVPAPAAPISVSSSEEVALIALYERVNPAVVSILVATANGGGQGSGFLFDAEGHIVTNQHVVDGAQEIEVDFATGFKARARVVGVDVDADLAVIKAEQVPPGVAPLPLGDSDAVKVGQRAIAIGNPFGRAGTMTIGIISGLGRLLEPNSASGRNFSAPDTLQTDAPINPGNSGGPLLNLSGEVIGINRAIELSPEAGLSNGPNSGVGYAIASNTVRQIVPYLIRDGKFIYPFLGVSARSEMPLDLVEQLGLPRTTGAYVVEATAGGPAEKAGVRGDTGRNALTGDGDLIIGIDGREVREFEDVMSYLVNFTRPGQEVTLTVLRAGQQLDVKVVLGERP